MGFKDEVRSFFILYSNGEVFNFNVNSQGEIYCREFLKLFGNNLSPAHSVEFTGNSFNLKDAEGNKLYSLEDYKSTINRIYKKSPSKELVLIDRLYIDEDVRTVLLGKEKISYDTEASRIPGLLYEPTEEQVHTRSRHK